MGLGAEAFTVLAIMEARDKASEIFAKVDESLGKFSETAKSAADTARAAGDEIDESLLKTASGADALDVADARVAAAQERAIRSTQALADAERELLAASDEAAVSVGDAGAAAAGRLAAADKALAAAQKDAAASAKALSDAEKVQAGTAKAAAAASDETAAAQDTATVASDASGLSLAKVGKVAGVAALGMGIAGALMVRAAGNFQDSTTHLVTDAGESAKNLAMVQAGILSVSTATGTSAADITNAMYHIESGGLHGAAGRVLKVAAEGARVGGADLDTVSKTLVGTLNAYYGSSMTAGNATQRSAAMMNELIATVGSGDMRMQDLASSLSSVAPLAAKAGLSLAQVGGAIATMTAQGMTAQNATQELAHTITSLQNPTAVQTNEMAQLGLSSQKVASQLGHEGLTGTIATLTGAITSHMGKAGTVLMSAFNQSTSAAQDAQVMLAKLPPSIQSVAKGYLDGSVSYSTWYAAVKTQPLVARSMAAEFAATAAKAHGFNSILTAGGPAAQTYTAALAKMTGGQTGLKVALMLSGQSAGVFQANVKNIADAAKKGGDQVQNWSMIQSTFNFKVSAAKTAIENTGIAIGSALLPAATALLGTIARIVEPIAEWTAHNRTLTEVIFVGVTAIAATIAIVSLASKAYKAITGTISDVKKGLQLLGIISKETATTQAASAETAAAAQETAAAEGAAANDEAAAETSASWIASAASGVASAAAWVAGQAVKVASVVASNVAGAATTAAAWVASAASGLASGALWVAESVGKVAVMVASNVAGAAVSAAAWMIANAAMLLGIGLIVAAVVIAVVLIIKYWKQISDFCIEAFHVVVGAVDTAIDWVKAHWPLILAIITGPIGLAVLWVVTHWKQVTAAVSAAIDWVKSHWPLILAILTGPIGLAVLFVVKHFDQIKAGAQNLISDLVGFFERLPGRILSAVGDLGHLLWNAGASIIRGLIGGLESMLGSLENTASSIAGTIKNFLPFSPARRGPLSGSGAPENSGKAIARLLATGMLSGASYVTAAAHHLAGSAAIGGTAGVGPGGGLALPAGGGTAGGPGGITIIIDVHGNTVMNDRDVETLANKVGTVVAARILPAAGVKVRFA